MLILFSKSNPFLVENCFLQRIIYEWVSDDIRQKNVIKGFKNSNFFPLNFYKFITIEFDNNYCYISKHYDTNIKIWG